MHHLDIFVDVFGNSCCYVCLKSCFFADVTHFVKVSPINLLNMIEGLDDHDDGTSAFQHKVPHLQVRVYRVCGGD